VYASLAKRASASLAALALALAVAMTTSADFGVREKQSQAGGEVASTLSG
jgi:hypothetical protein